MGAVNVVIIGDREGMPALADLLLPQTCPCGRLPADRRSAVCQSCRDLLTAGAAASVIRPYPAPLGLPICAAALPYEGAARRLVIAYKERGRRDLAGVLGLALLHALLVLPEVACALRSDRGRVVLTPVPASRAAFRERGVDHVQALAVSLIGQLRPHLRARMTWTPLLIATRRVADQAGLDARARRANLAGSLRIRSGGGAYTTRHAPVVVIIDDVLTSGATMGEAARALRAGGVRPAAGAVIAAVVRRDSRPALDLRSRLPGFTLSTESQAG